MTALGSSIAIELSVLVFWEILRCFVTDALTKFQFEVQRQPIDTVTVF